LIYILEGDISLDQASAVVIPGLHGKCNTVLSIGLLGSMFAGLNFRNAFPAVSAFAWSVPTAIFAAYFMHVIGTNMGEIRKVRAIEARARVV
jgi:hypothetical protein